MQIDKPVAEGLVENTRDYAARLEKTPAAARTSPLDDSDWETLIERIRGGDPSAREQFAASYSRGAKVFFKHNLGPVGLDGLVQEVMQGALVEVDAGLIQTPADLVAFFRLILKQQQGLRPDPGQPPPGRSSRGSGSFMGSSDKARIRRKAELLQLCLHDCDSRDREMLWRYYVLGSPLDQILIEFGADQDEFQRLKTRLYESIARADPQRLPSIRKGDPFSRKAAGGR